MYKLVKKHMAILLIAVILVSQVVPVLAVDGSVAKELSMELFETEEVSGGIRIKGFSEVGKNKVIKNLVFPSSDSEGRKVVALGGNFKGKYNSLVLPQELVTIESGVFKDVETKTVLLPETVKVIRSGAFKDSKISKLILPSALTEIGAEAFNSKGMVVHNVNQAIKSIGSISPKAFKGAAIEGDLIIPGTVGVVGEGAFEEATIRGSKLILGEGIHKIGAKAFKNLKGEIEDLILPNTMKAIGDEAFRGMEGLSGKVVVPKGVTSIGFDSFKGLVNLDKFVYYPQTDRVAGVELPKGPMAGIFEAVMDPYNIFDYMGLYKYNFRVQDIKNIVGENNLLNPNIIQDKLNILTKGDAADNILKGKIFNLDDKAMNKNLVIVTHERFREDVYQEPFKPGSFLPFTKDGSAHLVNYRRGPENFAPLYGKPVISFDTDTNPIKTEWLVGDMPTTKLPGQAIFPNIDSEIKITMDINEIKDNNVEGLLNIRLEDDLYRFRVKEATTNFANNERVEVVQKDIGSADYQIKLDENLLRRDGKLVITLKGRLEFRRGVLNKLGLPTTVGEWADVPGDTIATIKDLIRPLKVDAVVKTLNPEGTDSVDKLETEDQLRLHTLPNPIMIEDFEEVVVFENEEPELPETARIIVAANVFQDKGDQPITFYTGDWKLKWDKVDTSHVEGCGERTVELRSTWDLNGINPLKDLTNVFKPNIKELENLELATPKIKVRVVKPKMVDQDKVLKLDTIEVKDVKEAKLDKQINVEYTDGSIRQLDIIWDTKINDHDLVQEIKGHVEDECGRREVVQKVVVLEDPNEIKEVKDSGRVRVKLGDKPVLPETVTVVTNSDKELEKAVTWDDVDTSKVAELEVAGKVEDTHLKANIIVEVYEEVIENEIVKVEDLDPIDVYVGEEAKLPEKVNVIYANEEKKEVTVTWDDVDTSKVAKLDVEGKLEETDLKAKIVVNVIEKPVINLHPHRAYMEGYGDGRIKPNGKMTRAEAAKILFFVIEDKNVVNNHNFTDTKGHWAETEIATLASMGILEGYGKGKFKPNQTMTRAEVVTMLVKYKAIDTDREVTRGNDYSNHWAKKYIQAAIDQKIIEGYPDGTFKPENTITRAEMAKIVNAMFNRCPRVKQNIAGIKTFTDLKKGDWFYDAMVEATNDHMSKQIEEVYTWVDLGIFK